jgi:hypothetical protein
MTTSFSIRDKAILIGLYLARFDEDALNVFGFDGFTEAYNALAYAIGYNKPASIKNYRDEFDPYFPNPRKGRHKREIREYCKKFLDNFAGLDFEAFTNLIESFVDKNYDIEKFIEKIEKKEITESVVKRLITGKAAEEYFKSNYHLIPSFTDYVIRDTTNLACGFDFKVSSDVNFFCVEVKGLNTQSGSISMTEKEFLVAQNLKEKYCLFMVTNFIVKPNHTCIFDPLNSRLSFKKSERQVLQTNYITTI